MCEHRWLRFFIFLLPASLLVNGYSFRICDAQPRPRTTEACVRFSTFLFIGTVRDLESSTMPPIPPTSETFTVTIDEIIDAPNALGTVTNQKITVLSSDPRQLTPGQRYFFFATGLLYGRSMAVEETCRMEVEADSADIREDIVEALREVADKKLEDRIHAAESVVVGKVVNINPFHGGVPQSELASEHNPDWWDAEISVRSTIKPPSARTMHILYPNSDDVAWRICPKFALGQEGVWILNRTQIREFAIHALTALHPLDFQPMSAEDSVSVLFRRIR